MSNVSVFAAKQFIPGLFVSATKVDIVVGCRGRISYFFIFTSFIFSGNQIEPSGGYLAGNLRIKKVTMIYLTQLIYIREGQEPVFHQFEDIAIPAIRKYNGRLLLRVRPDDEALIESDIDKPYEIHLVEFDSEQDFLNFQHDEDRKKFLHLKEQSVKSVILIKGTSL